MNVGIFGGSFDPVHLGHLLMANQALNEAKLDQILFVPAGIPPHKPNRQLASNTARLEMLRLAIGGNRSFQISTCELDREGVSFTVDTLRYLREQWKTDDLFLLMGADSLVEFHTWKSPKEICQLATPIVFSRPGNRPVDLELLKEFVDEPHLQVIKSLAFQSLQVEISSTSIRQSAMTQKSFRYQTPSAVERYIVEKDVYSLGR
ncbi:MAG: nicotinate-nucleotide adenylyltransferase [Planctomycetota bacterium]|nr:nicotinate-nucleotide adenylyltransferase [Planctomycetota bacterium]